MNEGGEFNGPARTWLVLGVLAVAAGVSIMLVALGAIPTDDSSRHAPPWVIGGAGAVFLVAGLYTLVLGAMDLRTPGYMVRVTKAGNFNPAGWLVAAFVVSMFFAIASWVAFGPGERAFSGGVGAGGVGVSGPAGEALGRIAFGVSAVTLGAASVWIWAWGLRRLWTARTDRKTGPD